MRQSSSCAVMFVDEVDSICRRRNLKEEEYTRRVSSIKCVIINVNLTSQCCGKGENRAFATDGRV